MVARRAVALLLLAFCCSLFGMASASVPENALPDSGGDAPLPATISGAVAIVKRFQKKQLPSTPASTSDSPGQGLAEDPLHCTLDTFTSGTENPVVAATSVVRHDQILTEPSSEWPSPVHGPDSPEPIALASIEGFPETASFPDAFCLSDVEDEVSIIDQADFPRLGEHTFSAQSEHSFEEGLHSAEPNTDMSWSQVHSDELHSIVSGVERPALPYLQVSQPTTSSFSPLRRGPLFAESVEVVHSLASCSGMVPRPPPKARPLALKHYTARPKSLHAHSSRESLCARPKPPPPALRASNFVVSGQPKARPRPSQRGHYASYPSEVSRQLASEQGAISKAFSPCITQDTGNSWLSQAASSPRQVGGLPTKRGRQVSDVAVEPGPKKTVKQSAIHSGQWNKALTLWRELCMLTSGISSLLQEVLASSNSAALLEQLLRRISDTTALRYIAVLWGLFTTISDLQLLVHSISQVQLLDAIHVFQHSRSRSASVHSTNVLKALRWFSSTVKPDSFPSLHDGLFHSKSWHSTTSKREAVPLPLAFVHWLETSILLHRFSPQETLFAGAVLLCIWSSLRFGDAQHLHLQDLYIDSDSIRGVAYRTKTKKYMPFGCLISGLCKMPLHQCWVFHWLHTMTAHITLCRDTADYPDYIFLSLTTDAVRPLSYAETLAQLRYLLHRWGRIPEEQCLQYTLHSMKVTLLAFWRQADFSLEARHLQGHHVFAPSSTLYGRDDIAPILTTQFAFVEKVHSGWRPRTPILRGVSYVASEPEVDLVSEDLEWVPYIALLPFFHIAYPGFEATSTSSKSGSSSVVGSGLHSATSSVPGADGSTLAAPLVEDVPATVVTCKLEVSSPADSPLEEETSESEGSFQESLGPSEEVSFLCAETSEVLHASLRGKPACNCRGTFRAVTHPSNKARLCRARACAALFAALD